MGFSDVMDDWLGIDPPKKPKLPLPAAPNPKKDMQSLFEFKRKKGKGALNRAGTLVTGALKPMDTGKRKLLG